MPLDWENGEQFQEDSRICVQSQTPMQGGRWLGGLLWVQPEKPRSLWGHSLAGATWSVGCCRHGRLEGQSGQAAPVGV